MGGSDALENVATMPNARARFVLEAERSFRSLSELCRYHGISRPTGRKWVERFREAGLEALEDRSWFFNRRS